MKYKVGDKVRIIKPLYSDNPRLDEVMKVKLLRPSGNYVLEDDQSEWHHVKRDEIELVQEFSSIKELIKFEEKELNNQYRYGEVEEVDHPEHYNKGIETIDYIESHNLNFNLGNAIKYITRCEHKGDKVKDLEKAKWYIQREIDRC